jgi:hypothetical protein
MEICKTKHQLLNNPAPRPVLKKFRQSFFNHPIHIF